MQQQSAKKPPSSWTLRYQARPDFVNLARFSDSIDPTSLSNAHMYFQTEELRPDEDTGADSGDLAWKRRRRQRSFYRRKQTIQLNCEKTDGSLHYEGKHITVDLSNEEKEADKTSTDFKYVLLQFVKIEGSSAPEIHVIPVGDNFAFRKTGQPTDILLTEIEDKYNEEKEKTASLLNKYKRISQNITRYEKKKEEDEHNLMLADGSSDSFGSALLKAFSQKRSTSSNIASGVVIDDGGVDVIEAAKEQEQSRGDWGGRFVDDEEDHVLYEQEEGQRGVEQEMSDSWRYDGENEGDGDEEEEDEEEAENKKAEGSSEGSAGGGTSALSSHGETTMVNQDMLLAAAQAIKQLEKGQAGNDAKGGVKRRRGEDEEVKEEGEGSRKVRFNEEPARAAEGALMPPPAAVSASSPVTTAAPLLTSPTFTLSEAGVREYLASRGGKASTKDLIEVFKPITKAYARNLPNKRAGTDRLLSILDGITVYVDDPLLGRAVVLKPSA